MRRRLYLVLPDISSAQQTMNDLLLARIEEKHVHCLARRDVSLAGLHECNVLHKTDVVHGAETGLVIGALGGAALGILLILFPPHGVELQMITLLISALLGSLFGAWVSSLAAAGIPNSRLQKFAQDIADGKILMMVDVPLHRVDAIRSLLEKRHPEAAQGGIEPTIPAFP